MCGLQIWFCLFPLMTSKQLNGLTTIDTLFCLGRREVTRQTAVTEVLGSIPGSDEDVYVCFVCIVLFLLFWSKQRY